MASRHGGVDNGLVGGGPSIGERGGVEGWRAIPLVSPERAATPNKGTLTRMFDFTPKQTLRREAGFHTPHPVGYLNKGEGLGAFKNSG